MTALTDMAASRNGYITSAQATGAGIPRRELTEAVRSGELVQVDRGLYALPGIWEDPSTSCSTAFRAEFSRTTRRSSFTT